MHIIIGAVWQIKVYDQFYPNYVDPASGNVCSDQHSVLSGFKSFERFASLPQGTVGVYLGNAVPHVPDLLGDALSRVLGAGKHEHRAVIVIEEFSEEPELLVFSNNNKFLFNFLGRCSRGRHLDAKWKLHVLGGKRDDLARHGRRKKHGLPVFWQKLQYLVDLRGKADVEHPVCLIEHHDVYLFQSQKSLVQDIDKSARSGNDDMRTGPQLASLHSNRRAADEKRGTHADGAADFLQMLIDLDRELTSGQKSQPHAFSLGEPLNHRYAKSQGLACASLGDTNDVFALDSNRN